MTAYSIVLLLGLLIVTSPALANQHEAKGTQAADAEEPDDIGDDAGLISDEFSYTYLFDQNYGVLVGFGKSSPHHLIHLEGLAFLREKLAASMLIGYGMGQKFNTDKYNLTADTLSLSVKARYFLPLLPLSANTSCGYVFWKGDIASNQSGAKHDYKSYGAYLSASLSAYYFWKTGIYVESVLYGISIGKAFGLKTDADKDTITAEIEKIAHHGLFGGGLPTLTVGYVF